MSITGFRMVAKGKSHEQQSGSENLGSLASGINLLLITETPPSRRARHERVSVKTIMSRGASSLPRRAAS